MHPRTIVGNALQMAFAGASFDVVVTSPCYGNRLADHHNARAAGGRGAHRSACGPRFRSSGSPFYSHAKAALRGKPSRPRGGRVGIGVRQMICPACDGLIATGVPTWSFGTRVAHSERRRPIFAWDEGGSQCCPRSLRTRQYRVGVPDFTCLCDLGDR
jgi:hypothetical protein